MTRATWAWGTPRGRSRPPRPPGRCLHQTHNDHRTVDVGRHPRPTTHLNRETARISRGRQMKLVAPSRLGNWVRLSGSFKGAGRRKRRPAGTGEGDPGGVGGGHLSRGRSVVKGIGEHPLAGHSAIGLGCERRHAFRSPGDAQVVDPRVIEKGGDQGDEPVRGVTNLGLRRGISLDRQADGVLDDQGRRVSVREDPRRSR